jgi:KTSC domain
MMERQPVSSGTVKSIGYDKQSKELEIEFASGGIYSYQGVPLDVYEGLMRAESKGHFFAVGIRANYVCFRHHVTGCEDQGHPNPQDCLCWCHRLVKSEDLSHGANPSLEKQLKKSIKQAKTKKKLRHKGVWSI